MRGPFEDKTGKSLLEGGGTVVYGSNHGAVYAPGGLGVLPGNNDSMDILYYHYLNTSGGFKHGVSLCFAFFVFELAFELTVLAGSSARLELSEI